jgi:hypothetical protein
MVSDVAENLRTTTRTGPGRGTRWSVLEAADERFALGGHTDDWQPGCSEPGALHPNLLGIDMRRAVKFAVMGDDS